MFEIFVDSAANLPAELVKQYGIHVISFVNFVNGKEMVNFDSSLTPEEERARGKEYYDAVRSDVEIKTSLINSADFIDHFETALKEEKDILYISLSKNISGTFNAAKLAVADLKESYPDRKIRMVDSLNASLAQGILAIYAYEMRDKGYLLDEIADVLEKTSHSMNGTFTVGNLKYLAKTGRIKKATAAVGNLLSIKPILRGDKEGFIVQFSSCRGRKKSLNTLIDLVCENIVEPEKQIIGIAHADAYEDSLYVMEKIRERVKVRDFINTSYDYCTGSHVGPDTIAMFFIGYDRELQGSPVEPDYKVQQIFDMIG